jgi:AmiR/NasT family two-component response regulator
MSKRIVIADDEAVIRLDLKVMLEQMGHLVVGEADNGETALDLVRTHHPDLVIADIMMPKKNGLELAETLNRERIAPVLILTAYSGIEMIEKANEAGVLAYIVKPFRRADLEPAIELVVSRYREVFALEQQLTSVQGQMEAEKLINQAKKILMNKFNVGEQEALRRIQAQSLKLNKSSEEVASAIILTNKTLSDS